MDILVCDDHLLVADLIGLTLRDRGHRVAVTSTPEEAIERARAAPLDTCLMDLGFGAGHLDPVQAIETIVGLGARVIVLSGSVGPDEGERGFRAGASDYLVKGRPIAELVEAVERPEGTRRLPGTTDTAATPVRAVGRREWTPAALADFLTARERAVLEGLVRGESTSALAAALGVRPATARTHVQNLMAKLCVHSRLEAVAFAMEHHVVEAPGQLVTSPTGGSTP